MFFNNDNNNILYFYRKNEKCLVSIF